MKIISVLGARPQFIKAAAVTRAITAQNAISDARSAINELIIHTGQHFDANMSDVFFSEMGMDKPDYHLAIHGCGHGEMTGRMLVEIEKVLVAEKPDCVLVYGDTNSTLAGALAAAKMNVPVAHIEAGLRSFNMTMPEEVNRILTDRVSSILFCPTEAAVQNLFNEGIKMSIGGQTNSNAPLVFNVGDVMYDVALYYGAQASAQGGILGTLAATHRLKAGNYCLATIHRAENTDHPERLRLIFEALIEFSKEVPVILPIHPRTRKKIASSDYHSLISKEKSLILINPVGYLDMLQLEKYAALIATDSGGIQKEAFFHSVPCVTLRDETEWVELVEAGWNRLVPPVDFESMLSALRTAIGTRGKESKPYGNGNAAKKIAECLISVHPETGVLTTWDTSGLGT